MNKTILRYFYFLLGLFINSFGIAFITKSALGTSQISSVPYVLSLYFTMNQITSHAQLKKYITNKVQDLQINQ